MNVPQQPGGMVDLQAAFERLQAVSRRTPFPSLEERQRQLAALEQLVLEHQDEWAAAVNADFGRRSKVETRLIELFPTIEGVRQARRELKRWMQSQRRGVSLWFQPATAEVMPQPLGVVGIVVPWNYPIFLALGPLNAALAAGNRAMVKMSEFTPACGELFARLAERYFGEDLVTVVNGGPEVAQAFSALPFDHLLFTGSTAVGRQVMRAAAANLTPVTLELGGKSPVIVAPGFDPQRAAERIVIGKMMNAGQTCVAPDYLLVSADDRAELVDAIGKQAARLYPKLADNPDYSYIVNARHMARLHGWLEEARQAGAQIVTINPASEDLGEGRVFPLTLVFDAPEHCLLMQEEIFGPILPVVSYQHFEEALAYVNQRPRPLALYLFDTDLLRTRHVLQSTVSGGVTINDTVLHVGQHELPFGGVGPSGMGHYHGHEGFVTFSKMKPVFRQPRLNGMWMVRPPYGAKVEWLLKRMLGRAGKK
ncbi:coniferyl aldehyde dehydrogenase [Crenobacter sp. SG2303]|uniref:Aldehyde dehydrogenase n=1 Tax=Crenobacter oryzisoli TaxID=3056844 RepID=A0ABT7XIJ8_9NEIS|nr:coniferyl aldehyde dehydrogenase [Crenobacter sp. SG2303]MDN0073624.1 coniferyl aldehyde dehydrogenase [Crenobacter sp. SG2303]